MEGLMKRLGRLAVALVAIAGSWSCGSTSNDDALVLSMQGFDDEGIVQCDSVTPDLASIDVIQDLCTEGDDAGQPEPFTETAANAQFQNNQKLDITINSYTVRILDSGVGEVTRLTSQTVPGKRCTNDLTRSCAVDRDCTVNATIGLCQPSISQVQVLLADFTTKALIIPSVEPGGRTLDIEVTFFGSDVTGADWQSTAFIAGTFTDFNNCGCELTQ